MQVCPFTMPCAVALFFMFMPVKDVKLAWQLVPHSATPTGTWVLLDGAVAEPPVASGIFLGW